MACQRCTMPLVVRGGRCTLCEAKPPRDDRRKAPTVATRGAGRRLLLHKIENEAGAAALGGDGGLPNYSGYLGAVTWQQAEVAAAEWMRAHGCHGAKVTSGGPDGGIDVHSSRAVAQVKHQFGKVGRPAIQRLFAVAIAEGKVGLFFSTSGYTQAAQEWADKHGVGLFLLGPVRPVNAVGRKIARSKRVPRR